MLILKVMYKNLFIYFKTKKNIKRNKNQYRIILILINRLEKCLILVIVKYLTKIMIKVLLISF